MRTLILSAAMLILAAPAFGQQKKPEPPPHFGVPAETEFFPQDSPKQALASIAKAIDAGRFEYLLAHLVDPAYTDAVFAKFYRQKFGKLPDDDRGLSPAEQSARTKEALAAFVNEVKDAGASEPKNAAPTRAASQGRHRRGSRHHRQSDAQGRCRRCPIAPAGRCAVVHVEFKD